MHWLALLLLLSAQLQLVRPQACGSTDVTSKKSLVKGDDWTDAFVAVDNDATAGVIFMPAGTYKIARTVTLTKPIVAVNDAMFQVGQGVKLTIYNQPQHPYSTFFTGPGDVLFTGGTQFVVPEWFGAAANGAADDSLAIQRAYDSAKATGNAMLYLRGRYGIGKARNLSFPPGVVIMAEDSAVFQSVGGQDAGITFTAGNSGVKSVLPNLVGFRDFCVQLQGVSLGAFQLKNLTNCGDAIRIISPSKGQHNLDNTLWFDTILNSRVGIAYRAPDPECKFPNCIFQGNQVTGNAIRGGASDRESYAMLMTSSANPSPAWDSNNFDVLRVEPPNNPDYRVFHAVPNAAREIIKIAALGALPNPKSQVFGKNKLDQMQIQIRHSSPLQESQFGLFGELNLVELSGKLTPEVASNPIKMTNEPNTKAQFNNGKSIHGTYNTLQAVPPTDWRNGEVRLFFAYHQAANGYLYQIKCNAPKSPITKLPQIDCVQYNDNSVTTPDEVAIWLINQSGGTVKANTPATFTIAINTLGQP